MTRTVLIVDDEPNMRWVLQKALESAGYSAHGAESGDAAITLLARAPVDLVLLDLKLRGEDGLTILRRIREKRPEVAVIMLTAYGTVPNAVEAMQLGALDFLRKPFDVEEVLFKITRALERRAMQQEIGRLRNARQTAAAFETLLGGSLAWQELLTKARYLASVDVDVLITGESGSGRRSIAGAIHAASERADAPLVMVDLTTYQVPEYAHVAVLGDDVRGGAWAEAGSGTLLLVGIETAPALIAPLLECWRARPHGIGPRVVLVAELPQHLPPELSGILPARLTVPGLRERADDILLLAQQLAAPHTITDAAAVRLEHYAWPGNVSELVGVIARARLLAGTAAIDVAHLPTGLQGALPPADAGGTLVQLPPEGFNLEQVEQQLIRQALERARGNKSRAAELLGLTRHTLLYRMEKYGISAPERP
jgi:DNA-binding NtrC family response regulator